MKSVSLTDRLKPKTCVALIFLAALGLTLPIFINGVTKGNDLQQHFQFAVTFYNAILQGDFVPSLSTETNYGFGDVGVRFYPPLSYYLLALLKMGIGSWHNAAAISFLLWFFLGGVGVYLWSRESFSDAASLVAALAYMIAPYHVNEIYNASFFAEFAGAGVLPFCFLFAARSVKNQSAANIVGLGTSCAVLILTHLPTAVIGSIGLFVFGLLSLNGHNLVKKIASLTLAAAIGLVLSSFYWIKVVTELPLVNHSSAEFVARNYDFKYNFVASYFYVAADTYNDRFLWMSDIMFLVAIGLFVPSILFRLFSKSDERSCLIPGLALFGVGIFMATPLSATLWQNVSFLQKIQFPFRWMVLIDLAGAYLLAAGFKALSDSFTTRLRPLALISAGLMAIAVAFTSAQVIRPALFMPADEFNEYVAGLTNEPSYKCWLPVWATEEALSNKQLITPADRPLSFTRSGLYDRHFHFVAGSEQTVRLPIFYYPHWKVEIDGRRVPIESASDGALAFTLPSDAAAVRIFFEEPRSVRIAVVASLSLWLVIFAFAVALSIRNLKSYVNSYSNRELV